MGLGFGVGESHVCSRLSGCVVVGVSGARRRNQYLVLRGTHNDYLDLRPDRLGLVFKVF